MFPFLSFILWPCPCPLLHLTCDSQPQLPPKIALPVRSLSYMRVPLSATDACSTLCPSFIYPQIQQLAKRMALKLTIPLPSHFLEFPCDPKMRWLNWIMQLENFFTLTDLTLPKENKLTDRAKNAYLASLLGTEGARILMAHPVAATAESAIYLQRLQRRRR